MSKKSMEAAARFYANILPDPSEQEKGFRHGHWSARRQRIREQLDAACVGVFTLNRWDACGGQCRIEWSDSRQKFRLSANYCHSRHCEPCMRAKANLLARNLRTKLEEIQAARGHRNRIVLRFITLTLRHSTAPLADQLKKLTASFKNLRASKLWKLTQRGGCAILETKHSGTAWHPHLHLICEGDYIAKADLSELWHECTGDSFIVDVRPLTNIADACHYLVKYVTKGTSPSVWNAPELAQEWIIASKGVRTANTFGCWRGFKLTKPTPGVKDWKVIDTLDALIAKARGGELAAQAILLTLRPPGREDDHNRRNHPPP